MNEPVSAFVLGRAPALDRFNQAGEVTVSVYEPRCKVGKRRYVETLVRSRPRARVLYRIRVKSKQ